MKYGWTAILTACVFLVSCMEMPPKTVVFSSVVSVFQNLGYTIKSADSNTGFITAESATDNAVDFWGNALTQLTSATADVELVGHRTMLRINFVEFNRASGTHGQTTRQDVLMHDAELHQNAMFIRSG